MKKKLVVFIVAGLGLYLSSTGISYAFFSWKKSKPSEDIVSPAVEKAIRENGVVEFTGPKDEACPLNGEFFTKQEKDLWEQRRPLTVMIENHEDSRPQSGLSRADIVYEAVAEGGITRFLAIYYCGAAGPWTQRKYDLGPVRSARTYFLDLASEYADYPLYVHVGGAGNCNDSTVDSRARALCQLDKYGWKSKDHWSDMDQFALSYKVCRREPERTGKVVATEHTMYCDSQILWQEAADRDLAAKNDGDQWDDNFKEWQFKDEAKAEDRGSVARIAFDFWKGYQAYGVEWTYDRASNLYKRNNGGAPHLDFLTQNQLQAKVVIVQLAQETGPVDEHKHLLYKLIGQGKAIIFQDGKAVEGTWSKKDRQARTIFKDSAGKEIKLNRGKIWIEILPQGNKVDYEPSVQS